jgi:PadR family transcriptional regulator PadR
MLALALSVSSPLAKLPPSSVNDCCSCGHLLPTREQQLSAVATATRSQPIRSTNTTALTNEKLSSYSVSMPRRRAGTLIPIELHILEAGIALQGGGQPFYGFALAKHLSENSGGHGLTAHGTLYKALSRMTEGGLLEAHWEDAEAAAAENRPRRRLYRVTGEGELAWSRELAATASVQQKPTLGAVMA